MDRPGLYLASLSPRRSDLLRQIGVSFETVHVEVDERPLAAERPEGLATRLATAKAKAGCAKAHGPWPVLAADTVVAIGNRALGKPSDRDQGVEMLRLLGGQTHKVITAVALQSTTGELASRVSVTRVGFRAISAVEAQAYWESGEPTDKAGGYAIQGLGAVFVRYIEGSFSGVVGLPLFETAELLTANGIRILESRAGGRPVSAGIERPQRQARP